MVLEKFTKILKNAIYHYANKFEDIDNQTNIQIQIQLVNDTLIYNIAKQWNPFLDVTFKQVLLKKFDALGYEKLSTPYFKQSLELFASSMNVNVEKVSAFFCLHPETEEMCVAFYEGTTFKKYHKLSEELNRLGI